MLYFIHIFAHCLRTDQSLRCLFHVRIEFKQDMFFTEPLSSVRLALALHIIILTELLSAVQMQIDMLPIGRSFHISGIRYDNAHLVIPVTEVIYGDIIHKASIKVLMPDIHIITLDLTVKYALRYFQFRALLIY